MYDKNINEEIKKWDKSKNFFEENKNLFEKEQFYSVEATNGNLYARTQFNWVSGWEQKKEAAEFEKGSPYYMRSFYVPDLKTGIFLSEKDKEENNIKIATILPELETLVPERIKQDEKKLSLVNKYVSDFLDEHGVSVSDLPECPFGLTFNGGKLEFMKLESLGKENRSMFFNLADETGHYPEYILRSECWEVVYYDYVHKQYDKLLRDVKMVLHERFMNDTACLCVELQNE